jgi:hypothetical protein
MLNICFRLREDTQPSPTSEWFARTRKRTAAMTKSFAGKDFFVIVQGSGS